MPAGARRTPAGCHGWVSVVQGDGVVWVVGASGRVAGAGAGDVAGGVEVDAEVGSSGVVAWTSSWSVAGKVYPNFHASPQPPRQSTTSKAHTGKKKRHMVLLSHKGWDVNRRIVQPVGGEVKTRRGGWGIPRRGGCRMGQGGEARCGRGGGGGVPCRSGSDGVSRGRGHTPGRRRGRPGGHRYSDDQPACRCRRGRTRYSACGRRQATPPAYAPA